MCRYPIVPLLLLLALVLPASAADQPRLTLKDAGLPLQEVRPLDRRAYILILDGTWQKPPTFGVPYYVNVLFPGGGGYANRIVDDPNFRQGEVRCVIQGYQLTRNGLADGGTLTIAVSAGRPVTSTAAAEVVSNVLDITWPMDRPIVLKAPRSRHSTPAPVDAFPVPGEMPRPVVPGPPAPPRPELVVPPQPIPRIPDDGEAGGQ